MVCPFGTGLQTKEECEAFNAPGAGSWHGDLSASAAHLAVHPRGCFLWSDSNRHWIQPDGVLQTEALSKPICYGSSALEPVVMISTNTVCASGTDLQTKEECEAFNGSNAGTWQGDLSGSPTHVAVHPRGCWLWGDSNRHWIQPDGVLQTEASSKPICYGIPASTTESPTVDPSLAPTASPSKPPTRAAVVMGATNMVCPFGTGLQTKEECEAFNAPGAGSWHGDLSASAAHLAVHPRGCFLWSDSNRHWIQPDGVLQTEALSKPICYGSSALEPVVMISTNTMCASGTDLQTKEECE